MAPKKKGTTMSMAELSSLIGQTTQTSVSGENWADEEFELPAAPLGLERPSAHDSRPGRVPAGRQGGYGREQSAPLPVVIDQHSLPREPPFMAMVGNIDYDAVEGTVRDFFAALKVKAVNFPAPGLQGPRGYCFVEFEDVENLTEALMMSGSMMGSRLCRISVADKRPGQNRFEAQMSSNWREGPRKVIERTSPFERKDIGSKSPFERRGEAAPTSPRDDRPKTPAALVSDNWRKTAKPIESSQVKKVEFGNKTSAAKAKPPRHYNLNIDPKVFEKPAEEYKKSAKPSPFGSAVPRELVLEKKKTDSTTTATDQKK